MMKKLKYGCFGIFILTAVGFVACDKTETVIDEWTDVAYVYVKGETLGNNLVKDITVVETEGVQNPEPIDYRFQICLNRAATQDVTVALEPTVTGYIDGIKDNTITLSAKSAKIAAGKMVSDTVTLTVDPAFLGVVDAQGEYASTVFTVKMKDLQTGAENVRPTTKTDKIVVSLNKKVKAYLNIASGMPGEAVTMDRSAWIGELGAGVENVAENLYDGKTSTDVASNSVPWEFTIDMGATTEMLGLKIQYYASTYSVSQLEIVTSMDRTTWKSQGILNITRASTQNVRFLKPVTARYVKYRAIAHHTTGRSSVTEFNVYIAN